ncbi:hypothetical protein X744_29565 [Mesorhizobium sp. LNJC372A00]|nr:hypothetical protein X745_28705 [Mesorhizobium sp. LNJC374B00]ESY52258.1 hypothetical protein X744_29565 [Mesorhizobium sp. LNJC372A00]
MYDDGGVSGNRDTGSRHTAPRLATFMLHARRLDHFLLRTSSV